VAFDFFQTSKLRLTGDGRCGVRGVGSSHKGFDRLVHLCLSQCDPISININMHVKLERCSVATGNGLSNTGVIIRLHSLLELDDEFGLERRPNKIVPNWNIIASAIDHGVARY